MSATGSRTIAARPEMLVGILLRPLALPHWNPAFTAVTGPATAVLGERYPLSVLGRLRGEFWYTEIPLPENSAQRIAMAWEVQGLREDCSWLLEPVAGGTLVRHEVERRGPLALALRAAMASLPELRLDRLAEIAAEG